MERLAKELAVDKFRVVCFGSSAGGWPALRDIVERLRADTGVAFVIVAHRAPENPGLLLELLAHITRMPVMEVEEGMLLEPNRIFVTPPRVHMTMCGAALHLQPQPKLSGWPISISAFLFSLAAAIGARGVAVILSGEGYDGSDALQAIKIAGGTTFAQSDAVFASMPRSAAATGHVDFILSAAEIGNHLSAMGNLN